MNDHAPLHGLVRLGPWDAIPFSAAGEQLAVLAQRVADSREEIALTDEDGNIVAIVISLRNWRTWRTTLPSRATRSPGETASSRLRIRTS
ncbi:hypothetical protein [Streptomyces marincola]|uniref:hypothetical protein n=1 Tax=Streptomyces marincola TaxID=2878388 RepID=UPI001CF426F2|nr:hypothetical protein [Streptomyces marincola]UCM91209.1 hypothetical protein LC193_26505 [Streptomyces marincola]